MLLRFLIHQLVREKAEQSLREAMARAANPEASTRSQSGKDHDPSRSDPLDPAPPCDIAILFTSDLEAGGIIDRLQQKVSTQCVSFVEHRGEIASKSIVIAICQSNDPLDIQAATNDLIDLHQPRWFIVAGFASSLVPGIKRGTVMMANRIANHRGGELDTGLKVDADSFSKEQGTMLGKLLTVGRVLRSAKERQTCRDQFGADAADLESAIIAEVCRDRSIPLIAVRAISDEFEDEVPPELRQFNAQKTIAGKLGATAGALMRRPSALKEFWKMKQDAMEVSDKLAKFLGGAIRQLP